MKKRSVLVAGISVVVLLAIGGGVYAATRDTETKAKSTISDAKTPEYWKKAKATKATVACLKTNDTLNVPDGIRSDIEMSAMTYLIDVPAGTEVDVNLASYSANRVTGSDFYPDKFGTYNFTLQKDDGNWRVTEFKHCY